MLCLQITHVFICFMHINVYVCMYVSHYSCMCAQTFLVEGHEWIGRRVKREFGKGRHKVFPS